jgi:hypothetical protein
MIGQKGSPRLGRWLPLPAKIFGHRRFRHLDPQLQQFPLDAGCSPQRVHLVHAPNQFTTFGRHLGSSRAPPRFLCPIPGESSPRPTDDRVGLDDL